MQFPSKLSVFALIVLSLTVPILTGCGGGGSTAVNSPGTTPVTSNPVTTPITPVTPPSPPVTTPITPTRTIPAGELIPDPFFAKAPVGTSTYDLFDGWQVAPGYPYANIAAAGNGRVLTFISLQNRVGVTQPLALTPGQLYVVTVVAQMVAGSGGNQITLETDVASDQHLNSLNTDNQSHTYTFVHQAAAATEPITVSLTSSGNSAQISEVSVVPAPAGTVAPAAPMELVQDPTFAQIIPGTYNPNGPLFPADGWEFALSPSAFSESPTIIGMDAIGHYVLENMDNGSSAINLSTSLTTVPGQAYTIKIRSLASYGAQQAVLFYSFGTTETAGTENLPGDGSVHTFTIFTTATDTQTLLTIRAGGTSNLPPGASGLIKLYEVNVTPTQQASASARRKK